MSVIDDNILIFEGDLVKKGSLVKNWKERHFQLYVKELMYYKSGKLMGTITLKGCEVQVHDTAEDNCSFQLISPTRTYYIRAETPLLCQTWINSINEQIRFTTVIKEGYLTKRGNRVKTWKKRYFRLSTLTLEYYTKKSSHTPKGVIPLGDVSLTVTAPKDFEREYCFGLDCKERIYWIHADSFEQKTDWIEYLTECIESLESLRRS